MLRKLHSAARNLVCSAMLTSALLGAVAQYNAPSAAERAQYRELQRIALHYARQQDSLAIVRAR